MTPVRVAVVLACLLGAAAGAAAQDRPVVFIHGLASSPATWEGAAGRLQQKLAIAPVRPTVDWRASYPVQATVLYSSAATKTLPSNTVAIGHSNGGIVAREWSRGRSLGGIITLGTPNRGAPMVARVGDWATYVFSTSNYVARVLNAFGQSSSTSWVLQHVTPILPMIGDYMTAMVNNLAATFALHHALPVFADMIPGSPYLQQLNSSSNLAREAQQIPGRAGVASIVQNFHVGGPFRAFAPDHADGLTTAFYGLIEVLEYWAAYIIAHAPHSDIAAINQAQALISLAAHLRSIDPYYCAMVSATAGMQCLPHDGVLPYTTQQYPGAVNVLLGTNGTHGPAHIRQTEQSDGTLEQLLVDVMQVRRRAGAPPAPPPPGSPPGSPPSPPGPQPPPPQPPGVPDPSRADVMLIGDILRAGDRVTSQDGRYVLIYQGDGNLVLYGNGTPLWHTGTHGTRPGYVMLQHDGNFVLYDASQRPLWSTGGATIGHSDAWLIVQNDGNVVIYSGGGVPLWDTGTAR